MSKTSDASKYGTGITIGAGSGTLLVSFAQNLPDDSPVKPWLILLAPAFSVSFSHFWIWLWPFIFSSIRAVLQNYRLNNFYSLLEADYKKALKNPLTSKDHKINIQHRLEKTELFMLSIKERKFLALKDDE